MDYASRIETYYSCACGWKREYTDDPEWKARRIQHPFWGSITQYGAVQLDTQWHDCFQYHSARRRAPRFNEVPFDYEAAKKDAEYRASRKSVGSTR